MTRVSEILEIEQFVMESLRPASLEDRRSHEVTTAIASSRKYRKRLGDYHQALKAAAFIDANISALEYGDLPAFVNTLKTHSGNATIAEIFQPHTGIDLHQRLSIGRFTAARAAYDTTDAEGGRYYLLQLTRRMHVSDVLPILHYLNDRQAICDEAQEGRRLYSNLLVRWGANALDAARRQQLGLTNVPLDRPQAQKTSSASDPGAARIGSAVINGTLALGVLFTVFAYAAPEDLRQTVKTFLTQKNPGLRP